MHQSSCILCGMFSVCFHCRTVLWSFLFCWRRSLQTCLVGQMEARLVAMGLYPLALLVIWEFCTDFWPYFHYPLICLVYVFSCIDVDVFCILCLFIFYQIFMLFRFDPSLFSQPSLCFELLCILVKPWVVVILFLSLFSMGHVFLLSSLWHLCSYCSSVVVFSFCLHWGCFSSHSWSFPHWLWIGLF